MVSDIFVNHRIKGGPASSLRPINVSCRHMSSVSLCYLDYGCSLEIQPDLFEDFYLMLIPLEGASQARCGNRIYQGATGTSMILPAEQETSILWSDMTRKLVVRIDRRKLTAKLEAFLGVSLRRSPRFSMEAQAVLTPSSPLRQSLQGMLSIACNPEITGKNMIMPAFEEALFSAVLHMHQSDMSDAIRDGAVSSACPRAVRRAELYVEDHLAEPICIEDLAEAAGISARSLFDAFRRFRDMSPMRYVRFRRLQQVHRILLEEDAVAPISEIAAEWGFGHPGRFASEYTRQFGESPSQTRRKA
ncbi:AraC family transcriptional regulator [Hoeflea sp. YIM 152468]|uniref:AraC family transcriptional regulator n=1 Tax=Hoeflea sp. YIM 152468 TaxID=3031759 RepID=UPI0023DBD7F7|nr:AraC family transcriptional regulator [Hoeflea sp. YIM 152468]MDF1609542.1 AraC family transcriptional regulator [Hoeflea sp. YIM 152468]